MNKHDIIRDTIRRSEKQDKQIKSKGLSYQIPLTPDLSTEEMNAMNLKLFKEYNLDKEKIAQGLMKKGDSKARQKLIENNMRLVPYILSKKSLMNYRPEDMMQAGAIGLIKAIDSYDVNYGVTASSYISVSIIHSAERERNTYDKFQIHNGICTSLDNDDALDDTSGTLSLIDALPSTFDVEEMVLSKLAPNVDKYSKPISRAIDLLPKSEQYIVRTLQKNFEAIENGLDRVSMKELSSALNISYQRVFQLRDMAFKFIRIRLTPEEKRTDEDKKIYDSVIRKRNREIAKDIQEYLSQPHEKKNKYDAMKVDDSDVDYEKLAKRTAKRPTTFAQGVHKNMMNYLKLKNSGVISNATEYTPVEMLTESEQHDEEKQKESATINNFANEKQCDNNAKVIIDKAKGRYANKHCCFAIEDLEK